ncbi:MAG: hypothetical protein ABWY16_15240 [Pedobacter sp.]|uniref:hypothetical protein n=1 Tax=Pedobacter sp. TaxID=1411316 RepID=UPI003391F0CB
MNGFKFKSGSPVLKNLDSFFISLVAFSLVLFYTRHSGIGISPDSIAYLSVARNIIGHGAPVDYMLRPLVDFPVFYPFFLTAAGWATRTDPLTIAPWLNGLLLAGIIIRLGRLIDSFDGVSRLYKWIVLLLIAFSPSLLEIYSMLWSETLFLLLIIAFISGYNHYLEKRTIASLLLCGLIASIACITRYAGVTIIGTGLLLLLSDRSLQWRIKLLHCCWFGLSSVSLLVINLLRNALIMGSPTGPRVPGILHLGDNIIYTGWIMSQWLPVPGQQPELVSGIVIFIFIVICLLFLRRNWFGTLKVSADNCFAAFFIVYTVFIIGISTLSHFEQLNNRLLSPLYIPMVISLTSWIPGAIKRLKPAYLKPAAAFIFLLTIGFGYYQYLQLAKMYEDVKDSGIPGYTEDSWKNSETARFLRGHSSYFNTDYTIYSNAHEAAYFNGGIRAESLPHKRDRNDTRDFFTEDGFYLIWFDNFSDNELIKFKTILQNADVVKKYDFKDGDIFFIRPHHSSALRQ